MGKRFMMLLGAVLMLSGCSLFQSPLPVPPPEATCEEIPETFVPYMELAQRVPAFGGMFFEHDNSILYVYLTDLSQEEALKQAIEELYGPRWLELHMYPQEIRVLQGQYSYLQLKFWRDCLRQWIAIPGVTSLGIDQRENRITIGIDIGLKAARKRRVIEALETTIERLNIPREAVILEEMPPVVPKGARHIGRSGLTEIGRERLLVRILGEALSSQQPKCCQDNILGKTIVGLREAV